MRGCLTLPFRLALLALLALALVLGWTYRHELRRRVHQWTAEPAGTAGAGRAEPGRAAEVGGKLAGLGAGPDSVVLTATELASFLEAEAAARAPATLDSLEVRLGRDELGLRARVETRSIRLGPAAPVLRDREWVEAAGPLVYRRAGIAEWEIERARIRGVPVPRSVIERLLRQLSGSAPEGVAEIPLPAGVTGLRTGSTGLVLYGSRPR